MPFSPTIHGTDMNVLSVMSYRPWTGHVHSQTAVTTHHSPSWSGRILTIAMLAVSKWVSL